MAVSEEGEFHVVFVKVLVTSGVLVLQSSQKLSSMQAKKA
jgi:hypothetical protein